jgi:surface protein
MDKIIATNKTIKQIVRDEIQKLGNTANLNHIDTSQVTDMSVLFHSSQFNGDISKWDVSNVTNMSCMFQDAISFNQNIGKWDVSNVINMEFMFSHAESFNQNISNWDVSSVEDMRYMFYYARSFNQNISNWQLNVDVETESIFRGCPLEPVAQIEIKKHIEYY